MRAFAPVERFLQEVSSHKLKPGYVFVGDEGFSAAPAETPSSSTYPGRMREFSLYDFD